MESPFSPLEDLVVLPSSLRAPGDIVLPVHAFLLRGPAPVLIDTGMAIEREAFLDALDTVIDAAELATIVVTHEDADHAGALEELLRLAPRANIVVSATGAGKLSAELAIERERLRVVTPGDRVRIGRRSLRVVQPPLYDSPATFMLFEEEERLLFASDAFGAFVRTNAESIEDLDLRGVLAGMSLFGRANSPWIVDEQPAVWNRKLDDVASLEPSWLLASHLPPARGGSITPVLEHTRTMSRAEPREALR